MNILLSGAVHGIGGQLRETLSRMNGCKVFGVGLEGPDHKENFAALPREALGDMADEVFNRAEKYFKGPVDALINNAGITRIDFMPDHKISDFFDVLQVNLFVPFVLTRELLRRCVSSVRGYTKLAEVRILNTVSMANRVALRASPGYCASKAGLEALGKVVAKETAGQGPGFPLVTVANIAVNWCRWTGMGDQCIRDLQRTRGMTEKEAEKYVLQTPMKRTMNPADVWSMYKYALFDMPHYCSGCTLDATGAMGV